MEQTLGATVGVTVHVAGSDPAFQELRTEVDGEEGGAVRCRPAAPGFKRDEGCCPSHHTAEGLTHKKLYVFHVPSLERLETGVHTENHPQSLCQKQMRPLQQSPPTSFISYYFPL